MLSQGSASSSPQIPLSAFTILLPLVSVTPSGPCWAPALLYSPLPPQRWLGRVGAVPGPLSNFLGSVSSLPRGAGFLLCSCRCPGNLGLEVGILILRPGLLRDPSSQTHVFSPSGLLLRQGPFRESPSSPGLPGREPVQARGSSALPSSRCFTGHPHRPTRVRMRAWVGAAHLLPRCELAET